MKYLIRNLYDGSDRNNIEEYKPITLKELATYCLEHSLDSYYGIDMINPPHAELISTQNKELRICLWFDDIMEAKKVEVSLKRFFDYYLPLPYESNKLPLGETSLKIDTNTRLALKLTKKKGETYDTLISRLLYVYCSEFEEP